MSLPCRHDADTLSIMSDKHVAMLRSLVVEGEIERVVDGFAKVINLSFEADKSTRTRAEVSRRLDLCVRIFCDLRDGLKWTIPHIMSVLPRYVRCELDGASYSPEADALRGTYIAEESDPIAKQRAVIAARGNGPSLLVDQFGAPIG